MINWTAEEIAKRDTDLIKSLRENAARLRQQEIVDLCDAELLRRKPSKPAKQPTTHEDRKGYYVSEFHFVCPQETGVTNNPDGTKWTGTWVVATTHAKHAEKYGSRVALHTTKAEPSYLQGTIKGWKQSPREPAYAEGQTVKTEFGIDFLFEPSPDPLVWQGNGAGEKGYAWSPVPGST